MSGVEPFMKEKCAPKFSILKLPLLFTCSPRKRAIPGCLARPHGFARRNNSTLTVREVWRDSNPRPLALTD